MADILIRGWRRFGDLATIALGVGEPMVALGVSVLLVGIAVVASALPARRAMKVDPSGAFADGLMAFSAARRNVRAGES